MKSRIIALSAILILLLATSSGVAIPEGKEIATETILVADLVMVTPVYLLIQLQ